MLNRSDEFSRRITRQLRVSIERDDVANRLQEFKINRFVQRKIRVRLAAQKLIEFVQISALAFRANPFAFARIQLAAAREKIKTRPSFLCFILLI